MNIEMFGKYKIERTENQKGLPVIHVYNTHAKSELNSLVQGYYFHTTEQREKWIVDFKNKITHWEQMKMDRKKERAENRVKLLKELKPGTILSDSWGYDQTNVEFYKVLSVKGATVEIRELKHKIVDGSYQTHGMACNVLPADEFANEKIIKKQVRSEYIQISHSIALSLWDGQQKYCSWYA